MPASAILYYGKHDHNHNDEEMKQYCSNTELCRRQFLLHDFDDDDEEQLETDTGSSSDTNNSSSIICKCNCCDICRTQCTFSH